MIISRIDQEKRIISRCLNGERKAQHELFLLYKDAMFSMLYRMVGSREEAEDILQEGFISVFTHLKSFRGDGIIGGWMKTIFVRIALRRLNNKVYTTEVEDSTGNTVSQDESLTGELLEKLISELDKGYRTVFLLVEVEGYKHKEVAEMLGISEGTSKSQLSRAKAILREKLKGLGYE